MRRVGVSLAAVAVGTLVTASCGGAQPSSRALRALDKLSATAPTTTTPPVPSAVKCEGDPTASLRPSGRFPAPLQMPKGTYMHTVQHAGQLKVGVDENTLGISSRDPKSNRIVGFEPALALEIAKRIFGPNVDKQLVLVPLRTDQKIKFVQDGSVDLTIDAITMDRKRCEQVAFSTEYYRAVQKFLVRRDSSIATAADLAGRKICVTNGSSSLAILQQYAPKAIIHAVGERTACLVALQEGEVDAYFGHDSFLYGMLVQDKTMKIVDGIFGPDVTTSHYGIAIDASHPEFVRFVNAVLEQVRSGGRWRDLHADLEKTLAGTGIRATAPPAPRYKG
jgi:polar amino acid transport system substrate-binding protein